MKHIDFYIKIIVVVPFIGYDSKWPDQSKHRLKKLIQNSNDSIVISHSADVSSYKKRNYYMVDHAEYIIGVFDNQKKLRSGTAQTVNYALHQGKVITLIHPDTMEITAPCALTNSQKFFISISNKIFSLKGCCDIIRYKTTLRTNGAAMNKYIGQQFAALRYEKNILVVEETTSAGGCGSFNAASSCPASACLYDSAAWGFFIA